MSKKILTRNFKNYVYVRARLLHTVQVLARQRRTVNVKQFIMVKGPAVFEATTFIRKYGRQAFLAFVSGSLRDLNIG